MKSLKKALVLVLALMLLTASALMLFSCGEETPCTEHKDNNTDGKCDVCGATVETPPPESDGIDLIKDGKATFKIVIPTTANATLRMKVEENIVAVLDELGIKVEVVNDKADTVTDFEVIIGQTETRGDQYKIDPHYLGSKGYAVKLVGTKVLLMAGSDKKIDDAIEYFVETVLGITGKTKELTTVTMTEDMSFEEIQTDYAITSVKIAGNDLKDYVIVTNNAEIATPVQTLIYENTGIWLKIVAASTNPSKVFYINTVEEACDAGFSVIEKNGNLVMECEFKNKFSEAALGFVRTNITSKKGDVTIKAGLSYEKDVRRIYYKDFGAKGDGRTDDFIALRDCHNYANQYGHTVCSDIGSPTYYIGDVAMKLPKSEQREIIVQTDTDWTGASFIFDDAKIPVEYKYEKHKYKNPLTNEIVEVTYTDLVNNAPIPKDATCTRCLKSIYEDKGGCSYNSSGWHTLSIFVITSKDKSFSLKKTFENVTLSVGDEYITLADGSKYVPGRPVLIELSDSTKRHYIRYGGNANNGSAQTEIILVNADGRIDASTPLHWDYAEISSATAKYVDDEPIQIGTDDPKGVIVTTYANQGPNYYYSYGRNIVTERSNTTVKGIKHYIEGEGLPGKGKCPQGGFTRTTFSNNVTYENMLFTHQKGHKDAGNGTALGTYEISAGQSNIITWKNCDQTNFYDEDGYARNLGFFGTNYCKNFYIYDSLMCSFDAHCGTYNVTLVRSTFEHINCVGEGLIYLEDVNVYTDFKRAMISLRTDYGAPWRGDLYAKNVTLKHSDKVSNKTLSIFNGNWTNHTFGFTCYLPENITLENLQIYTYSSVKAPGEKYNRKETLTGLNDISFHLFESLEKYTNVDISDPDADMGAFVNDWAKCLCGSDDPNAPEIYSGKQEFNDTDGDGRCNNTIISTINVGNKTWCWGFKEEPDSSKNANPYIPTKVVNINNSPGLQFILPGTPQFKDTKVYVDGVIATPQNNVVTVPQKNEE